MSAIFGVYNLDGRPLEQATLEKMSAVLSHRGADSVGLWCDGPVGFGNRMLWTTPESLHETLPYSVSDGTLTITADARIDNRDELLAALELPGKANSEIGDGEIILRAYRKWGEECPARLLGDFAFAIWDKHLKKLFCARDHFGVRPFYYYRSDKIFVFASEVKGVLCPGSVPKVLNELSIGNLLSAVYDDVTSTFYKDVLRLPPAFSIRIDRSKSPAKRYWSLDPTRELKLSSDGEYADGFRELFTRAVQSRMRSAYPIGSLLSGGLDSSSIACTASKLSSEHPGLVKNANGKIDSFSAVFGKITKCDESRYINAVLRDGKFEPHYVEADQLSPFSDLERVLELQDSPMQMGNHYILWHLFKKARHAKVRVLLDGFDGDTTVSHGKMYLLELARAKRWMKLLQETKGYSKNFGESFPALSWAYLWKFGIEPGIANYRLLNPIRRLGKRVYQRALSADKFPPHRARTYSSYILPEFADRIQLEQHQKQYKAALPNAPLTEREDHYLQFQKGITPFILEAVNKSAAVNDLEIRYPFWDRRLAEYCLSLPGDQKMRKGYTRMIMRRAMNGILPKEVQWRPGKSDLAGAFDAGVLSFERPRFVEFEANAPQILEKYVDVTCIPRLMEQFLDGDATVDETIKISTSVSLALWLQTTEFTN